MTHSFGGSRFSLSDSDSDTCALRKPTLTSYMKIFMSKRQSREAASEAWCTSKSPSVMLVRPASFPFACPAVFFHGTQVFHVLSSPARHAHTKVIKARIRVSCPPFLLSPIQHVSPVEKHSIANIDVGHVSCRFGKYRRPGIHGCQASSSLLCALVICC